MKKLLFIPLLFAFYIAIAQTTNPSSIIGNPIKIGNLLVAQYDFQDDMNWDDAKAACEALGKGWRLPKTFELDILYLNSTKIGGDYYKNFWSSKIYDLGKAYFLGMGEGNSGYIDKFEKFSVRAVKSSASSASIIGKPARIGYLLVAQYDFQDDMNWDDAKAACEALGKGWRLPSKIELNTLYLNKARISGFLGKEKSRSYWSNTEVGVDYAWCMGFYEKYIGAIDKTSTFSVRAVRSL
jgi:hypothetical protein